MADSDLSLTLMVGGDTPDGVVRLDVTDMHVLGISVGDIVALEGVRRSYVRVLAAFMEDRNQKIARVSALTAGNIGYLEGRAIRLVRGKISPVKAELVTLAASNELDHLHLMVRKDHLGSTWRDRSLTESDSIEVPCLDSLPLFVKIVRTQPSGPVVITRSTRFSVAAPEDIAPAPIPLGGLRDLYMTCRTLIERRFKRKGGVCAGAVLLSGPAGCGKASLVKRLAEETGAKLKIFEAHQLLDQLISNAQPELTLSLSELSRGGPLILLFDHLEILGRSLLPQESHKVLAQISSVLDEVSMYPDVLVFAVCSDKPEPRLVTGSLFDSHFEVDLPHRWARHEVLLLATGNKRLAEDVDLAVLANLSGGLSARELFTVVDQAALLAGEQAITQKALISSLRSTATRAPDFVFSDIPSVLWDDMIGVDEIKDNLQGTLLLSLKQHERFSATGIRPPCSILLSGGQGTGKTSLVRALASFMPLHLIEANCRQLTARGEGVRTKNYVQEMFALARRKAPCIVFLDDIEALFDGDLRPESNAYPHPLVEYLMFEVDAVAALSGIVVIAATSRPDRLTNEVLRVGRFDFSFVLSLPEATARRKILQNAVKCMPLASDIDFDRLSSMTHGFSPADLANLCNRVGLLAFSRAYSNGADGVIPPVVDAELFEQALRGHRAG